MFALPLTLSLAAAPQAVRVLGPDPAEVAAARLPVPDIVMTRAEADALSDAALAERLIGHVAHGRIVTVGRQRDDAAVPGGPRPLGWVSFAEAAVPIGGRLCRGRTISVTFDTPDGQVEPVRPATSARDRPRRVFWVGQEPTLAVVAGAADARSCAATVPARVGRRFDEAVALVRQAMAAAQDLADSRLAVTCDDSVAVPPRRCDPRATLAALDWTRLSRIDRTAFTGEPVRWSMVVGSGPTPWQVIAIDTAAGRRIELRRENPPPF